jgi:aspartokinase-like uncharacterized kinase
MRLRVIKLGGSLLLAEALPACLAAVARLPGCTLVVPGGGAFAEQVRLQQALHGFDEVTAHRMAILAMQQMALVMQSLQPDFRLLSSVADFSITVSVAIWSPAVAELDNAGIAPSWDITSDSLAAWLAGWVQADELILVKSAQVANDAKLPELQAQGMLDAGFLSFAARLACPITVLNHRDFISA